MNSMFCPFCGFHIEVDAPQFCPKCGKSLASVVHIAPTEIHQSAPQKTTVPDVPAESLKTVHEKPLTNSVHLIALNEEQAKQAFLVLRDAYKQIGEADATLDAMRRWRKKANRYWVAIRIILSCSIACIIAAGIVLWAVLTHDVPHMWWWASGLAAVAAVTSVVSVVMVGPSRTAWTQYYASRLEGSNAEVNKERVQRAIIPLELRLPEVLRNAGYVLSVLIQSDSAPTFGEAMLSADKKHGFAGEKHLYDGVEPLPVSLETVAEEIAQKTGAKSAGNNNGDSASTNNGIDAGATPKKGLQRRPKSAKYMMGLPIISVVTSLIAVAMCVVTLAWAAPMRQRESSEHDAAAAYCSEQYKRLTTARSNADEALGKVANLDDEKITELSKLADGVGKESCSGQSAEQLQHTADQYRAQTKQLNSALTGVNTLVQAQQSEEQKQLDYYSNFKQLWTGLGISGENGYTNRSNGLDGTYCREDDACLEITYEPTQYSSQYGTLTQTSAGLREDVLFDSPLNLYFSYQSVQPVPSTIISIYLKAGRDDEMCGSAMSPSVSCRQQYLFYVPAGMNLQAVAGSQSNSIDWMLGQYGIDRSNLPDSSKAYLVVGSVYAWGPKWEDAYSGDSDSISNSTVFYKQ